MTKSLHFTLSAVLAFALSALFISGCDSKPQSGSNSSSSPTMRIAVIPKGLTHSFWNSVHAGALQAAKDLKKEKDLTVEVIWDGPDAEHARDQQIQIVQDFTGQNINGIVLAPLDDQALVSPIQQAMAAGKPVVIIDSGLKADTYVSFVATDNFKGGELAGKRVGEILSGKGTVLLLRYMVGSASTHNREEGFLKVIKEQFPNIKVVPKEGEEQYAGATAGEAQEVSESLLNIYKDIDAIFCPNESSAVGMLEALKSTGKAGKVKFVGFDSSDKLLQGLDAGHIDGLVLQDPVKMGREGVKALISHLKGEKVEKRIDTGVVMVTPDNRNEDKIKALLTPDLSILKEK